MSLTKLFLDSVKEGKFKNLTGKKHPNQTQVQPLAINFAPNYIYSVLSNHAIARSLGTEHTNSYITGYIYSIIFSSLNHYSSSQFS